MTSNIAGTEVSQARPTAHTVPTLSSFIGRERALEALDLAFSTHRLVTLVGPPGIGKSRLASRYVETRARTYARGGKSGAPGGLYGGAWFCDLTQAMDGKQAKAAVCACLGLVTSDQTLAGGAHDAIQTALEARGPLLLVLDNFEQLVRTEAAELVARWCEGAPELAVLITSRERLRAEGEMVLDLDPLDLPSLGAAPSEVLGSEAARLFRDRARAAGAGEIHDDAARSVGALVRALDGLPLAIELAAARARTLAPAEILSRLEKRFDILKSLVRDASATRHATLENAIAWSWDLLDDVEQRALAQCSVFAGGFSLDAAERVLQLGVKDRSVLDVIDALCDKSLVASRPASASRRFSLFVSIRDFAARRLSPEETAAAHVRHAEHYLEEAERCAEAITLRADADARAILSAEQENVAAVFHRFSAPPLTLDRAGKAIRSVLALYPALETRGPSDELFSLVDAAVTLCELSGVAPSLRARALFARGCTHGFRGNVRQGIADLETALRVAEAAGDAAVRGEALVWLSVRYRHAGRYREALDACHLADALLTPSGAPRMIGLNLAVRGRMRGELGETVESRRDNERAMAIFRELGDRWYEGLTLANLGQLDMQAGDLESARWYYEQSLVAFRQVRDPRYEGLYLGYLGCLEWESGNLLAATARLGEAIAMLEEVRTLNTAPLFRAVLGGVLAQRGDLTGALRELDKADHALLDGHVPAHRAAAHCHRGHLDLARARSASSKGADIDAAALRSTALERVARARLLVEQALAGQAAPLLECSDDVRFAVRMLERAAADIGPRLGSRLEVGPDARWFAVNEGPRVDLGRRNAMRLILVALVRQRDRCPGSALSQEALLCAGWPGERVLPDAGSKRVRVAISTLRRLGLGDLLVTHADGYMIEPQLELRVAGGS